MFEIWAFVKFLIWSSKCLKYGFMWSSGIIFGISEVLNLENLGLSRTINI